MKFIRLFASLCGLLFGLGVQAQNVYVPGELAPWQEWVLHDHEYVACPIEGKQYRCLWPGRLKLSVDSGGGRFEQTVEAFRGQYYVLPGGGDYWPLDVLVDGKKVPVVERDWRPMLFLEAGEHRITGTFRWTRSPDTLSLNNGTGLLSLTVDGDTVARPRWNANEIWLGQGQQTQTPETQNQMSVSVYRLITDGAPVRMVVQLKLDISGESREETIGKLVPEGFSPSNLVATLPARLDDDGKLKIQARPGEWVFTFNAIAPAPLESLEFIPTGEHWPKEEVWSYAADPRIRATEVRAANAVDPGQAGVPREWLEYPAFQMNANDQLQVVERQRGRAAGESNRLTLNRELWLDFDREGYTARDTITGTMVRDWRLDLSAPFQLESATIQGSGEGGSNLLVTQKPGDSATRGVEMRMPAINLSALARVETGITELPVAGWDARFDTVRTSLYLPPGHRLIAASNVDRAGGSWIALWDLLDFFVVLIVTVAVWRLIAPWAGVMALLALSLSFHETGAPNIAWLNLVAAFALAKYLPEGRLRSVVRSYSWLSLVAVTLILLPFAASSLRTAVYPQLEVGYSTRDGGSAQFDRATINQSKPSAPVSVNIEVTNTINSESLEDVGRSVNRFKRLGLARYAKNARIQTGPGVPAWGWARHILHWNGPVDATQTSRLWIAPPWVMSVWRVMMVLVLAGLLAGFASYAVSLRRARAKDDGTGGGGADGGGVSVAATSTVAVLMAAVLLMCAAPLQTVRAETPSPAVLEELRTRLIEAPECVPNCVDISRARIAFSENELRIDLIAHAQAYSVLKLPGRPGSWMPEEVTIDGRATDDLRLGTAGVAEIKLNQGVHRIVITGALPNANSIGVAFPAIPHHIEVDGTGWEVTGLANDRLSGGALTLIRQQTGREPAALDAVDVEQFPAFVIVTRQLHFNLVWSVRTVVMRVTPPTASINLSVPLIPGESVTQEGVEVEDGFVQVNIPAGAKSVSWSSSLVRESTIEMVAATDVPWQENWELNAGDSWRLEFDGVPELNTVRRLDLSWVARFTPWPGETLKLNLSRPAAVDGATMAIDSATVMQDIGTRSSSVELGFSYRATRGSQHKIRLPVDSDLTRVMIDGQQRNLVLEDGWLQLPIVPGSHEVQVGWRSPGHAMLHTRFDAVELNMPASNVTSHLQVPTNRWVLWTYGPQQGPAVLYWSELLALIGVAFLLARFGRTPLRFHHWVLLGLGFSTFFWPAFAIVAVALLALAWRKTQLIDSYIRFNMTQIGLGVLVVCAAFALIGAIPYGLLGDANMHVVGNSSSSSDLFWFIDQTTNALPTVGVLSLPMWIYKAFILLWALWLAFALIRWLPWMWQSFSHGGYWRARKTLVTDVSTSE